MTKKILLSLCTAVALNMTAGNGEKTWHAGLKGNDAFIENKGQFPMVNGAKTAYAYDNAGTKIYFSAQGLTYALFKTRKAENEEEEERERERENRNFSGSFEDWVKKEKQEHLVPMEKDYVSFTWENANPAVNIIAEQPQANYHSYCVRDANGEAQNLNYIQGYQKITYKNLYPGIDVVYTLHPEGGIKYAFNIAPGADISLIKMKYANEEKLRITSGGDLHIKTIFGNITDHAPSTFYGDNSQSINSRFVKNGNLISFQLDAFDASRPVIIDPWTVTPTLSNSNAVWECEKDASGNVYIIGGEMPLRLQKYNSSGVLQWTYNTPWDTTGGSNGDWLGTFATDQNGNSYVTNGSTAALQKINTGGTMVYSVTGGSLDEYWNISFNCDQTRLVIGGTRLHLNGTSPDGDGVIFDINASTGAVLALQKVGKSRPGFLGLNDPEEVRSITSSYNARYYFLTLDTIGAIDQNFSACSSTSSGIVFRSNDGYAFGYKCENWRPTNGNAGIMAIRANKNFVYTQNGTTIQKRSLSTGAVLASATIPGGSSTTSLGKNIAGNCGIDLDSCGNVYVGSSNQVVKYDANLNQLSTTALPFHVYDVCVSYGGEVVVCGATGTGSTTTRTGYVQSINMGACYPNLLACCNANICSAGPFCVSDPSYTLSVGSSGGTWSGAGVNASGVFSPSTAGVGTHAIVYSLPCGKDTAFITVNACTAINVCINNGTLTATGGTSTYTWSTQTSYTPCVAGFSFYCGPLTAAGVPTTSWTPQATGTSTFVPGSYPVLVKDGAGTTYTVTTAGSVPNCTVACATPTVSISSVNNVNCAGGNNGSATVTAVPAGTYTYTWLPGNLNGSSQSGLSAGNYTVTATNGGCSGSTLVSITQPTILDASPTSTSVTCFGGSNGTCTLTISGGTPSYTVSWSGGGGTGNPKTGLSAGSHTATITDAHGCTKTVLVNIAQPTDIVTTSTVTAASCGLNNGSAVVSATGGTGVITYSWSTGATGATLSNVGAGTYTVTSTDANGCTDVIPVTINSSSGPSATAVQTASVSCFGSANGTATVSISGGTPGYTVTSSSGTVSGTTINNLPAGTVTATVTDAHSCVTTTTLTIGGPSDIVTSNTVTPASCGAANGSAVVSATGGTGVLTYSWSTGASGTSISNVNSGTYTVTVTDANGCTDVSSVTITNNGGPSATAVQTASVSCFGLSTGSATVNISGGTPNYTITSSAGNVSGTSITNLPGGTFTTTVTDANNCITTTTLTINQPTDIVTTSTVTPASCGSTNGSAVVNATGGSGVITYSWSTGATGTTLSGVSGGVYTVVATDANGCKDTSTVTITSAGGPVATAAQSASVTCNGASNGTATLSISGGTPGYTVTCGGGTVSGTTINNLPAGTYTATITDANSCVSTTTVTINEPAPIAITFTNNSPSACAINTGSVTANANGGTGVITYSWSTGASGATLSNVGAGNYTVTATDANNCSQVASVSIGTANTPTVTPVATASVDCNGASTGSASVNISGGTPSYTVTWSGGGSGTTVSGQPAGTQTVTVTDAGGCVATGTVTISQPAAITATLSASPAGCTNAIGSATVVAAGGTPTYTYTWSNSQTGNVATGLSNGVYTVTITDANNCVSAQTVSVGISNPPVLAIDSTKDILCNGQSNGVAYASSTGGIPGYTYSWSNSQSGAIASGLGQGSYTVIVTDAGGCKDTAVCTINQPSAVAATIPSSSTDHCGLGNGSATASATGGTPGYTYQWSSGANTATAGNLSAGIYTVTATDAHGCTATQTVAISSIAGPTLSVAGTTDASCNGSANGSATVTPAGGTPAYTYTWSSGASGASAGGLSAGTYTAIVADSAGCISTATVSIQQPAPITIASATTSAGCSGGNSGTASATPAGGTTPFTINWSNGQTGATATGLSAGIYTVTVTDAHTCPQTATVTITDNLPTDTLMVTGNICINDPTVVLTAPHGGVVPDTIGYPYQWYQSTSPITGATTYTYTGNTSVTNNYSVTWFYHGCRYITSSVLVTVAQDLGDLPAANVFTPNDDQMNDEFLPFSIGSLGANGPQLLKATIEDYDLLVYDRWGVLMLHSTDVSLMWDGKTQDGKPAPDGTYFWIAKYKVKCSKNTDEQTHKGYVQLVR